MSRFTSTARMARTASLACLLILSATVLRAAPPSLFGIQPPSGESKLALQALIGNDGDPSGIALGYSYAFSSRLSASVQLQRTGNSDRSYVRGEVAASLARMNNSSLDAYTGLSGSGGDLCLHTGLWAHLYTGLPLYLVAGVETGFPDIGSESAETSLIAGIELPVTVNLGISLLKQTPLSSEAYDHYATGLIFFF
ncbi:MAG: hypothetical protein UMU76_04240 [Prosthecochloris sp.]|nr:hypothetical protein [Prosthecochloris sp.]